MSMTKKQLPRCRLLVENVDLSGEASCLRVSVGAETVWRCLEKAELISLLFLTGQGPDIFRDYCCLLHGEKT